MTSGDRHQVGDTASRECVIQPARAYGGTVTADAAGKYRRPIGLVWREGREHCLSHAQHGAEGPTRLAHSRHMHDRNRARKPLHAR